MFCTLTEVKFRKDAQETPFLVFQLIKTKKGAFDLKPPFPAQGMDGEASDP